jgi:RND family efflux transporter MFP subunit
MMVSIDSFQRGAAIPAVRSAAGKLLGHVAAGVLIVIALLAAAGTYLLWPVSVDVIHPRVGPAIVAVYASGTVEASIMLPVAPRIGGRLIQLGTDEHASVVKGKMLAQLESEDLVNNIAQLKAQADFAKFDFARYERLIRDNAIAPQIYDRARATWQTAEAAVAQARAQAGFMTLTAPDNCYVIKRDGEVGQFIAANTPLFWLSCHSSSRISAQVDEEDVALVRPGQPVLIRADAFPGRIFNGSVTEVTPKGDPVGRSYRVRIDLPADSPLQIGMTTEANIVIRTNQKALLLPTAAVTDGAVQKIVAGQAVRTPVTEGVKSGGWIEIVKGVSRDDLVVSDGHAPPAKRSLRVHQVSQ